MGKDDQVDEDENELLQWIQEDLFPDLVDMLYWWSRDRYLDAVRLVGVKTEL